MGKIVGKTWRICWKTWRKYGKRHWKYVENMGTHGENVGNHGIICERSGKTMGLMVENLETIYDLYQCRCGKQEPSPGKAMVFLFGESWRNGD